jgi:pimeloyl-ACP methyl ester carboxylesterase
MPNPPSGDKEASIARALASNTEHVIFCGQSTKQKLLIVFSYIDQPIGTCAHARYLDGTDCKKLFLNPGVNHWYQSGVPGIARNYSELLGFVAAVRSRFADHEILCLGHSMGAFPALGIGVAIGAHRVLASVPEVILRLPGSVSARYLTDVAVECGDITPLLVQNRNTACTVLIGRRTAADLAMAARIAMLPMVEIVEIDSDHATFPYLRDQGMLRGVLSAFVEGTSIASHLSAHRTRRRRRIFPIGLARTIRDQLRHGWRP